MGAFGLSSINRVDAATVTASSEAATLPASYVANPKRWLYWRSLTTAPYLDFDFGANVALDLVALFGMGSFAAADTLHLKLSTVAAGGTDVDGVGPVACNVVQGYAQYGYIFPATRTARYLRIAFATAAARDLRRAWAGPLDRFTRTWDYGSPEQAEDGTAVERAPTTGAEFADPGILGRRRTFELNSMTSGDHDLLRAAIKRVGVGQKQIVAVPDTAGDLARDMILGLVAEPPSVARRAYNVWQANLTVRETPYTDPL
jgi:hypothetical protein